MFQHQTKLKLIIKPDVIEEDKKLLVKFGYGSNLIDHPQRAKAEVQVNRPFDEDNPIWFRRKETTYGDVSVVFYFNGDKHAPLFIINNPEMGPPTVEKIYNDDSETRQMDQTVVTYWNYEGRSYSFKRLADDSDGRKIFQLVVSKEQ